MLRICWRCYHFTNRRGLFGLCYEPGRHLAGMRDKGHAPYACALCPACDHFILNNIGGVTLASLFRGFKHRRAAARRGAQVRQRRTDKED